MFFLYLLLARMTNALFNNGPEGSPPEKLLLGAPPKEPQLSRLPGNNIEAPLHWLSLQQLDKALDNFFDKKPLSKTLSAPSAIIQNRTLYSVLFK